MKTVSYITFTDEQLSKIGNTIVYLSQHIPNLSKTKLLKLLYILDELSIKKSGIPFLNLKYKVWKFGPVSEELFIDLSSEPALLKNFISKSDDADGSIKVIPKVKFSDEEFTDNDMSLMDFVVENFGNKTAMELVSYTHRKSSPWYITAKEHSVLELLESEKINNTEFLIDLGKLVEHDSRKREIYNQYSDCH
jgi:uncharacterized phage-associated protein